MSLARGASCRHLLTVVLERLALLCLVFRLRLQSAVDC